MFRSSFLLIPLAGCAAAAPSADLGSLVAHPATFAAMPGPGPHRGFVLVGSAKAADVSGLPERLRGREGSARFLPGRTRTKVVDGVFHFTAALMERDFNGCVGNDPDVTLVFEGGIVAAGRLSAGPAFQGSLGDYHPVWKER